ncbi:MAG: ABC transporter permease, partial [Candidatus Pacebacteria bacterium]|nr:ABC transporter permease [Candidatus Paceibacterota bacterium]
MISDIILSSLEIGLIYAIVSLGVFITFKILNFPDLTVDGSLVTGAAISAISIQNGFPIIVTLILSFLGGSIGGLITAFIHVRFNIDRILSGIITLSLLYTINLRIMGS